MSPPFAAFSGATVCLDTMIPYPLLRGIDPAARTLFQKFGRDELRAYTSVLTFDELSYRLLLALIRDTDALHLAAMPKVDCHDLVRNEGDLGWRGRCPGLPQA